MNRFSTSIASSPSAAPLRQALALAALLSLLLLMGADEQPADRALQLRSLQAHVLTDPFNLQKLDELRQLRAADLEARAQSLQALAGGLSALLKDDRGRAAGLLSRAAAEPSVRDLARSNLGHALWDILFPPPDPVDPAPDAQPPADQRSMMTLQNLCTACGHTGRMDCRQCRGDGYDRGETCRRCEGTGTEACVHAIHRAQAGEQPASDGPRTLTEDQRRRVQALIDQARYLAAGGADFLSSSAVRPSPRVGKPAS